MSNGYGIDILGILGVMNSKELQVLSKLMAVLVFSSLDVSLWGIVFLDNSFHIHYCKEIRAIWI